MQVAAMVAALLVPGAVFAQSGTATISGVVRDSSGAAIPGATLRVVNEGTSASTETVSGDGGVYRVRHSRPDATAWRPSSTGSRRRSRRSC